MLVVLISMLFINEIMAQSTGKGCKVPSQCKPRKDFDHICYHGVCHYYPN